MTSLSTKLRQMRADPARQQAPVVSACTGVYHLDDVRLGDKHTVNVGSDDCEQRSWTHQASFKVLRRPRSARDYPICLGEASGTWTWRVAKSADCSGEAAGVQWQHK